MSEKAAFHSGDANDDTEQQMLQSEALKANESLRRDVERTGGKGAERLADGNPPLDTISSSMKDKLASLPNDGNPYTSQEHVQQVLNEWTTFFAGGVDALMGRKPLDEAQRSHQQVVQEFNLNLRNESAEEVNDFLKRMST